MVSKDPGFEIFAQSIRDNFTPMLNNMNFQDEQIDPRLFIFSRDDLKIKIYFPECHGYDITVTLSPTYTKTHYDKSERNLYWFGRYLKFGEFLTSRRTEPNQIPELVKLNVEFLKKLLDTLDLSKPYFWNNLDSFIEAITTEEDSKYKF